MNTVSVSDLMRELQAGEEARTKVPALTSQIASMQQNMDNIYKHNQELELSIIDYKRTIDGLNAKVRSLEVERDDAGFRELEASDKVNTLMQTLRALAGNIDDTVRSIDPPKPEPVAPETVQNAGVSVTAGPGVESNPVSQGERVTDPISAPTMSSPQSADAISSGAEPTSSASAAEQGQSDPRPTASLTEATHPFASGDAASPLTSAPSTNDPQAYRPFGGDAVGADKPNEGRGYYRKPYNMSDADWYASGGLSF